MPVPYLACMLATAQAYHLPPRVLPSIQAVEGGYPGAIHPNSNGTEDYGVMQINSIWLSSLAAYVAWRGGPHVTPAQVRVLLIKDACFNIAMAAAILQTQWVLSNRNWVAAVGNYHSHTPDLHNAYVAQVIASAVRLFGHRG